MIEDGKLDKMEGVGIAKIFSISKLSYTDFFIQMMYIYLIKE